jgi:uncharacterized protein (DUF169 family)
MTLQQQFALTSCILGLQREIVAVNFFCTAEEFEVYPILQFKRKHTFCSMVRLASIGHGRKALSSNFRCRGASEVFRFVEPGADSISGERLFGFGLYAHRELAGKVQSSMARLATSCSGLAVLPLSSCTSLPQSIVIVVDAYQAMRLVQAWAYHHGLLEDLAIAGNRGICSECVARPLTTGKLHLSMLCANTRHVARWSDQEMGIGLPGDKLGILLDGLIRTIPAVETSARKRAILRRCVEAEVEFSMPEGKAYFIRG